MINRKKHFIFHFLLILTANRSKPVLDDVQYQRTLVDQWLSKLGLDSLGNNGACCYHEGILMTFLIARSLKTGDHQHPLVCSNPSHKFDHFFNTIIWALVTRSVQSFVAKNSTSLECLWCVSAARVVIRWVGVKNYATIMAHVVRGAALAVAVAFRPIRANIPRRDWNGVCVHLLLAPGIVAMRGAHFFVLLFCSGWLRCCLCPDKTKVNFSYASLFCFP